MAKKTINRKVLPKAVSSLRDAELKLEKKKIELLKVKKLHKKIAGEFIDQWVVTRRLKKQASYK